jgi:hypothetical protein
MDSTPKTLIAALEAIRDTAEHKQCADTAAGRRRFVEHLDKRAREEGIRADVIEPEEDRQSTSLGLASF